MPKIIAPVHEENKAAVATVMLLNPKYGSGRVADVLKDSGRPLDKAYVLKCMKEVAEERATRYIEESQEVAMAKYDDLCEWITNQCRAIMQEELKVYDRKGSVKQQFASQSNRIQALKLIILTAEKALNFKMDLGIFERQLGKIKGDATVLSLMAALKEYEQYKGKGKKVDGKRPETVESSEESE